jgi:titin
MPATVPSAPSSLSGSIGDEHVHLNWIAPNNGGYSISAYRIYRSNGSGVSFYLLSTSSQTSYTDSGLVNGNQYVYKVSAVNQLGEGAKSGTVALTPMTVPSVPGGLRSYFGDAKAYLVWDQPLDNGGGQITSYNIYIQVSGSSRTLAANTNQSEYWDNDLVNGYRYEFTVAAVNPVGEGVKSLPVTSEVYDVPSNATDLRVYSGINSITLTWKIPGYDGGSSIIQYAIYRASSSDGESTLIGMTNQTYYTDKTVEGGTSYYYRVGSENAVGFGEMSEQVSVKPLSAPIPWLAYLFIIGVISVIVAVGLLAQRGNKT